MAQTEAKTENRPRVYGNFRTPTSKGLAGLSTAGTVLLIGGVVGGILLTLNLEHILRGIETLFGVVLMPEDVYYVTGLPTELRPDDIVAITIIALGMAFVATLYGVGACVALLGAQLLPREPDGEPGRQDLPTFVAPTNRNVPELPSRADTVTPMPSIGSRFSSGSPPPDPPRTGSTTSCSAMLT